MIAASSLPEPAKPTPATAPAAGSRTRRERRLVGRRPRRGSIIVFDSATPRLSPGPRRPNRLPARPPARPGLYDRLRRPQLGQIRGSLLRDCRHTRGGPAPSSPPARRREEGPSSSQPMRSRAAVLGLDSQDPPRGDRFHRDRPPRSTLYRARLGLKRPPTDYFERNTLTDTGESPQPDVRVLARGARRRRSACRIRRQREPDRHYELVYVAQHLRPQTRRQRPLRPAAGAKPAAWPPAPSRRPDRTADVELRRCQMLCASAA